MEYYIEALIASFCILFSMNKNKFKSKFYINTSDKVLILIIAIILLTYIFIKIFTAKSEKLLFNYANNKSIQITSILINKALFEVTYNNDYTSFMNISRDTSDVLDVSLNNKKANELLYLVNENIFNNLHLIENGKYSDLNIEYLEKSNLIFNVPIGVIYDIPILVDIGPKIPFKLDIIGNTNNTIYTNIKDYGINNSIIEIILKINLNIQIILPFTTKSVEINKDIPLDTKIIEGKVPTYYGGINNKSN